MRKIISLSFCIISFLLLWSQASAATFTYGPYLFLEHRYYADATSNPERLFMTAAVSTEDPNYDVYVWNAPSTSGDVQMVHVPGWVDFYPYLFARGFSYDNASDWENRRVYFWGDADQDGYMDSGEPFGVKVIPKGTLVELPFVRNISISPGAHPTIKWQAVPTGFLDSSDYYLVRFFPIDPNTGLGDVSDLIYQSPFFSHSDGKTYTLEYTGDLFEQYGKLAISIEARDMLTGETDYGLLNHSRYLINHVVPIPSSLFLLAGGLVGIISIRRKAKKIN